MFIHETQPQTQAYSRETHFDRLFLTCFSLEDDLYKSGQLFSLSPHLVITFLRNFHVSSTSAMSHSSFASITVPERIMLHGFCPTLLDSTAFTSCLRPDEPTKTSHLPACRPPNTILLGCENVGVAACSCYSAACTASAGPKASSCLQVHCNLLYPVTSFPRSGPLQFSRLLSVDPAYRLSDLFPRLPHLHHTTVRVAPNHRTKSHNCRVGIKDDLGATSRLIKSRLVWDLSSG